MANLERVLCLTIPVKPRTKKNHQQIIRPGGGRPIPIPSKEYRQYENDCLRLIPGSAKLGIDYPVNIRAIYYVDSKRKADKTNLESALMDMLVKAGVLMDDSAINPAIAVTTDGSMVKIDRKNPRIEIEITKYNEWMVE